ncbi:MAG: hypothetical protein JWM80_2285 [Cyanobacteria bacterium RYN_339]|nr:hypothetical protein [Cyanobacteria bacterium RYN_339]
MLTALLICAAAAVDRTDWERFVQPTPYPAARLAEWLGHAVEPEPETPAIHFFVRDREPFKGGIDLWKDDKGNIESANFYFALGPIYSDEHVAAARKTSTPFTLEDVLAWYGEPAKRATAKRQEAERWTYNFQGDPKRQLTFTALAGSRCLHSVFADRE